MRLGTQASTGGHEEIRRSGGSLTPPRVASTRRTGPSARSTCSYLYPLSQVVADPCDTGINS